VKKVAIIQARTGSTRLPGKVLMDIAGETMLAHVVQRTQRARLIDALVVATTDLPGDDAIVDECARIGAAVFRGHEHDVLGRYYEAAVAQSADMVVRITADCPLTDPELVDSHIERMLTSWRKADLVTNMMRQTFPLGLAVEAMPFDALQRMHRMSDSAELREHVTTLAYERPELFSTSHVLYARELSHMRWTVDTPQDLDFIRRVFGEFPDNHFNWEQVLPILARHDDWMDINNPVRRRPV
jgi:spore coat polysaccharide biosynthesis protein SpsF